ncbi:hypothetical protein M407DRAFT_21994 [Tulasnella calospora MUT 4182]|uniref:BAG domain-containing protein n=1 Tax=Tulasnella calospora MUT 4182 TaxID=1051891 RepID=A0A0C3QNY7_9AGAM|nr:hypothetical protein M407DRAFT_21994 [Tulasnella calospora MUT 4182]
MFFIQRPAPRFPQYIYRPDYYQQSPEERYYRELAEEHNRRADLALRLAQQERQRILRAREIRSIRARQHQKQLASRSQCAPQHCNRRGSQLYNVPDPAPALDLVLLFANEPPRNYPPRPAQRPQPSEAQRYTSRRPTSFFEHLLQTLDASHEPESERPAKRVRFGPEQAASAAHPQSTKQDKGKARAQVQNEPTRPQREDAPNPANQAPSFWDFFGGLQALEEEDAIVRQLNLFDERLYPGVAQQGVAGPSGTRRTKPAESSKSPAPSTSASASTARPAIPIPVNTTVPASSTSSSTASSPKSHAGSFTSLDAIQSRFDALKSSFVFPNTPQFESAEAMSSGAPRLSYSSSNSSVHEYENELTKLLTELDAVESDGAESVRGARKALVVAIEKELEKLDEEKKTAWRNSVVELNAPGAVAESKSAPETSSEPRGDASEAESTWIAPVSTATGEEVRGYDVFEPTVEQSVPASTSEEPESALVSQTASSPENPIAPSDSIAEVEVADPAPKDDVEAPAPVVEMPVQDLRDGVPEASESERFPTVQGQPTDSASESEDETVGLAGEQRHSDSEVEPFVDVQQASPVVSEASLGEFDRAPPVEETTKDPSKNAHASDDEFEML